MMFVLLNFEHVSQSCQCSRCKYRHLLVAHQCDRSWSHNHVVDVESGSAKIFRVLMFPIVRCFHIFTTKYCHLGSPKKGKSFFSGIWMWSPFWSFWIRRFKALLVQVFCVSSYLLPQESFFSALKNTEFASRGGLISKINFR